MTAEIKLDHTETGTTENTNGHKPLNNVELVRQYLSDNGITGGMLYSLHPDISGPGAFRYVPPDRNPSRYEGCLIITKDDYSKPEIG